MGITYAIEISQVQEIRYSKAKVLYNKGEREKAFKLLYENLTDPYHEESFRYLSQIFFDEKEYTKAFRVTQRLLKASLGPRIATFSYNPQLRSNLTTFLEKQKSLSPNQLKTGFESALHFYKTFEERSLPKEYSNYLLNLAEKYFLIALHFKSYQSLSKFYLSKIFNIRGEKELSYNYLLESLEIYDLESEINHIYSYRKSDAVVFVASKLAKDGNFATSKSLFKFVLADEEATDYAKQYAKVFLKENNQSGFSFNLKTGIVQRNNANQSRGSLVENQNYQGEPQNPNQSSGLYSQLGAGARFESGSFLKSFLTGSLQYRQESALGNPTGENVNFKEFSFFSQLERPYDNTNFYGLMVSFNNLNGRNISSLYRIQETKNFTLSPFFEWVSIRSLWKLSGVYSSITYQDQRQSTSLGAEVTFEPQIKNRYFSPTLQGYLGFTSEGNDFEQSTKYRLSTINSSLFSNGKALISSLSYEAQSNTFELLTYQQLDLKFVFRKEAFLHKKIHLDIIGGMQSRTHQSTASINSNYVGLGLSIRP